jgi:hypothetical protein
MPASTRIRAAALLAGGALAVHELRYLLSFGSEASHVLAVTGHGYLTVLAPLVTGILVAVLGGALARFARGGDPSTGGALPSTARLWAVASATLLGVHLFQETLEVLVTGRPGGVTAALGDGGPVAVPLALLVGAFVALALRGSAAAESAAQCAPALPSFLAATVWRPLAEPALPLLGPIVRARTGRGPPPVGI